MGYEPPRCCDKCEEVFHWDELSIVITNGEEKILCPACFDEEMESNERATA